MDLSISSGLKTLFEQLGKAFLIAGYLPAALFVALNQYLIFSERFKGKSITLFAPDFKLGPFTGENIAGLILPLFIGMLLFAFNTLIIQFFEGAFKWQQDFLLRPWMRANRKRCRDRYGKLITLKNEYIKQLVRQSSESQVERDDAAYKVTGLRLQIQAENDRLEKVEPMPSLPQRVERIRPTALGNTFALMEEYPYDRYGIDAVAIWPRLQTLLPDALKTNIGNQKLLLDFLLNLVALAGLFGIEAVLAGLLRSPLQWALIAAGVGAFLVAWALYRAAISVTAMMGLFVTTAFDYYRGAVLEKFGLTQPATIEEEQFLWLQLASFLRRGEAFKLPARAKSDKVTK